MKEQDKNPEKQLNEVETSTLPEKAVLRGMFIVIQAYLKKQEKY